jgi:serine O-acetyltransferase
MIRSYQDYQDYLNADKIALGKHDKFSFREFIFPDPIWRFQRLLRKTEYFTNTSKNFLSKSYSYWLKYRLSKLSLRLGFSIPLNVFGPGLAIVHYGTIVVHHKARVGKNCRIHVCTNIGASGGSDKAPVIGDNVYLAPGVKIYGDIKIGNNIAISANAVVNRSFEEEDVMLAGVPAKVIKPIDIKTVIKHL